MSADSIRIAPLVFGLAFVGIGLTGVFTDGGDIDLDTVWLWVVAFLAIGLAGLIASIVTLVRR